MWLASPGAHAGLDSKRDGVENRRDGDEAIRNVACMLGCWAGLCPIFNGKRKYGDMGLRPRSRKTASGGRAGTGNKSKSSKPGPFII